MKIFFKDKKISFDTKDVDTLACFSAVCYCFLVWFWTFMQIHIIYLFYLIISANLSHLTEAKSSVIWKAVHCVNKEYINLGHSEPERSQCRKRMGNTVHTRASLLFGPWFSDAQMF